jgi:hypothetical protein
MANGRCRMHSGKALGGVASPTFKHGRYSRFLPQRVRKSFEEFMAADDPLCLLENIGVLDARAVELLSKLDAAGSLGVWRELQAKWDAIAKALKGGDCAEVMGGLNGLDELLKRGVDNESVWEEILKVQKAKAYLAAKEWRRLADMQQMVTLEQLMAMMAAITSLIAESVSLREDRLKVLRGIERLLDVARNAHPGRSVTVGVGDDPGP